MELTTANLRALRTSFRAVTLTGYQGVTAALHQRLCLPVSSSAEMESYNWLGALPGLREFIGPRQIKNVQSEAWTVRNRKWESTVGVDRAAIERDTYGVYKPLAAAMGEAAAFHPDELLVELMTKGFSRKCYDGKNYFASNHGKDKGAFSNVDTKKFNRANFLAARTGMLNRTNSEGRSFRLGRKLLLVVSPTYESEAEKVVKVDTLEAGGGNPDKGKAELQVWPELAAAGAEHAWFLFELGQNLRPFVYQTEVGLETQAITDPEHAQVFINDQWLFGAYQRDAAGYLLPELAFGSDGTTAAA